VYLSKRISLKMKIYNMVEMNGLKEQREQTPVET
jgi:hypothetical protein